MSVDVFESKRRNSEEATSLEFLELLFRIWGWYQVFASTVSFFLIAFWSRIMSRIYASSPADSRQDLGSTMIPWLSFLTALWFMCTIGAILSLLSAHWLKTRTNWSYIRTCSIYMFFRGLIGLGLGVYALTVLNKEPVKVLFGQAYRR